MRIVLACCLFAMTQWVSSAGAQEDLQRANFRPAESATGMSEPTTTDSAPAEPVKTSPPQEAASEGLAIGPMWRVLRTTWTDRDERAYEEFVQRIGESDCRDVHECLTDLKSNPLY